MIQVHELSKSYGHVQALSHATFGVAAGEILGLLGSNGAGKSTAMKIMAGQLVADEGRVEICGVDTLRSPLAARARIGYLPEHAPLYNDMEVHEYLRFCGSARGIAGAALAAAIEHSVTNTGLGAMLYRPIATLSRGYRQRTGLAQALLHKPAVLILDEATAGLDPLQICDMHELLRSLARSGVSIVFSTHIITEAETLSDRVLILHRGSVLAHDTARNIRAQAAGKRTVQLRCTGKLDHLAAGLHRVAFVATAAPQGPSPDDPGLVRITLKEDAPADAGNALMAAAHAAGATVCECFEMSPTLGDAFLFLVTKAEQQGTDLSGPGTSEKARASQPAAAGGRV